MFASKWDLNREDLFYFTGLYNDARRRFRKQFAYWLIILVVIVALKDFNPYSLKFTYVIFGVSLFFLLTSFIDFYSEKKKIYSKFGIDVKAKNGYMEN